MSFPECSVEIQRTQNRSLLSFTLRPLQFPFTSSYVRLTFPRPVWWNETRREAPRGPTWRFSVWRTTCSSPLSCCLCETNGEQDQDVDRWWLRSSYVVHEVIYVQRVWVDSGWINVLQQALTLHFNKSVPSLLNPIGH